jgi:hypothetical protein
VNRKFRNGLLATSAMVALIGGNIASPLAADNEELLQRIEQLEQQIDDLRTAIEENQQQVETATSTADTAQRTAVAASRRSSEPPIADTMWHLTGYADVGMTFSDQATDSFTSGKFNPAFHFQYKDLIIFESELELETDGNATDLALEYSQFDILLHDNITLTLGKFLSPVGQFQERLHPSWINKLSDAPVGFGHGGAQPISEVGIMARGGVPIGGMRATYALALGNGPRLGHGGVELEGFSSDANSNKAISGRFAVLPLPWLELGGSFMSANMTGPDDLLTGLSKTARYRLWGLDGAITRQELTIRGEYLNADVSGLGAEEAPVGGAIFPSNAGAPVAGVEEVLLGVDSSWRAWYLQGSYRLSGFTDNVILGRFEPTVRYGEFILGGDIELAELSEKRFDVGLSYWIAPSIVGKIGIGWRNFVDVNRADETLVKLQLSYGF